MEGVDRNSATAVNFAYYLVSTFLVGDDLIYGNMLQH